MLTEKLTQLTLAGGSEWVMVLLIFLSVVSLAIAVERALFLRRRQERLDDLDRSLSPMIKKGDLDGVQAVVEKDGNIALNAALSADGGWDRDAAEKIVASALERERLVLERRLAFLGTLGNNAPFIGLLGTVLGIIRAFNDLSLGDLKGHSAVMSGISEALVATALGLFVAIPAVVAYNFFSKQVDRVLSITGALAQVVLARHPSAGSGKKS